MLASTGIGLSMVPLVSYGQTSNSTSQYIFNFTAITNEYASFTYILPTVKQGNALVITGKLIDAVTLQPLSALIDAAHKRLPSQSYSLDILNSTRKVIKDGLKDS